MTGSDKRNNEYTDEEGNAEQEGCFEQESERGNYERTARSQEEASASHTHGQPDNNPKSPRNDFPQSSPPTAKLFHSVRCLKYVYQNLSC